MEIKAIVVDDEELAREGVILHLRNEPDICVVAECANGKEAIEAVREHSPDLVFLDIKMPELSGFDCVNAIGVDNMPIVIFLTAYSEYAIKAFQVNALDYLLKPINSELFKTSVERARQQIANNRISEHSQKLKALLADVKLSDEKLPDKKRIDSESTANKHSVPSATTTLPDAPPRPHNERIVVRSHGVVKFLNADDIFWIEAEGDYIAIHTENKSYLIRDTMRNIEQKLVSKGFMRIHRSTIVQLRIIDELVTLDNGEYEVNLLNGSKLKLSRTYRDALFEKLQHGHC